MFETENPLRIEIDQEFGRLFSIPGFRKKIEDGFDQDEKVFEAVICFACAKSDVVESVAAYAKRADWISTVERQVED